MQLSDRKAIQAKKTGSTGILKMFDVFRECLGLVWLAGVEWERNSRVEERALDKTDLQPYQGPYAI